MPQPGTAPATTAAPGAPPTRPARRRFPVVALGRMAVLGALLGLTAWTVTRSDALGRAEEAYRRAGGPADYAEAARLALEHLGRRPWSREAARTAALALSKLESPDAAEGYYRRAGQLGLEDRHVRAYALLRNNRREEATAAYQSILSRWPDDAEALRLLGGLRLSQSRWSDALDLARRLTAAPGGAVVGHTLAGTVLHDTDYPDEAADEFLAVLELDPDLRAMPLPRRDFWLYLCRDLLASGRPGLARRHLERAQAEADGDDPAFLELLGQALHLTGHPDEAERRWRQALDRNPRYTAAWIDLGRLALERNDPAAAIGPLERALELAPRADQVLYSLIRARRLLGQRDEADRLQARLDTLRGKTGIPTTGMNPRGMSGPAEP